jgi:hypothetical protein
MPKEKIESIERDRLAKSRKATPFVIPAKAGIQYDDEVKTSLDPGFHRGDGF